jgi:phosphoglycolate phosphatase
MTSDALPRLAIFDCDGTLVDSQADICAAMDAAFATAGLIPPIAPPRRIVGLSLHEAMRRLHPAGGDRDHAALAGY